MKKLFLFFILFFSMSVLLAVPPPPSCDMIRNCNPDISNSIKVRDISINHDYPCSCYPYIGQEINLWMSIDDPCRSTYFGEGEFVDGDRWETKANCRWIADANIPNVYRLLMETFISVLVDKTGCHWRTLFWSKKYIDLYTRPDPNGGWMLIGHRYFPQFWTNMLHVDCISGGQLYIVYPYIDPGPDGIVNMGEFAEVAIFNDFELLRKLCDEWLNGNF